MKLLRIAVAGVIFIAAGGAGQIDASVPLSVDISAPSAILIDAETGAVLYQKNAQVPMYPASITKVATALYALEKKGDALDELVTVSADAVMTVSPAVRRSSEKGHPSYRLEFGGTHMSLKPGEVLSLRTLLYGLMLASANDAANVIAQHVSGSPLRFVEELNTYLKSIGCTQTVFHQPHGLYSPDHKTTALDMALITKKALEFPFFREVVKTVRYSRGVTNKQPDVDMVQHNALLKPGRFYYPKAIGVKTGYIESAGYTLTAAAEDVHRKLILVLLGCSQLAMRYKDAIALFEAGFHEKKVSRVLFSKEYDSFSCSIPGAVKTLTAKLKEDLALHYYPSDEPDFTIDVKWLELDLPVAENQLVAEVRALSSKGVVLSRQQLFASQKIEGTYWYRSQAAWLQFKAMSRPYMGVLLAGIGIGCVGIAFYRYHHPFSRKAKRSRN